MPNKCSQLQFERDPDGVKCLVYREDAVSKTHDGGIADRKSDCKEVWIYPNDNVNRCTVRLIEKYLSLCPNYFQKRTSICRLFKRSCQYSDMVNKLSGLILLVKLCLSWCKKGILRDTTPRLFRAGVDRKLVKEVTGHRSDAVDDYQITGHDQRKMISKVVQGDIEDVRVIELKENSVKVDSSDR